MTYVFVAIECGEYEVASFLSRAAAEEFCHSLNCEQECNFMEVEERLPVTAHGFPVTITATLA